MKRPRRVITSATLLPPRRQLSDAEIDARLARVRLALFGDAPASAPEPQTQNSPVLWHRAVP